MILEAEDVVRFNKVVEMLDSSISELRRVAHNMMPDSAFAIRVKGGVAGFLR